MEEKIKSIISLKIYSRFIFHFKIETWGYSIFIMDKNGFATARIYGFDDDDSTAYLDGLSVSNELRRQGIGTLLQELREQLAIKLGANKCWLWTNKDAWMRDWYKRRGYADSTDYQNEENCIWMEKQLV